MNLLVTAGNTQTPIDKVRCLTNIFSGRTGTRIALTAHQRGHDVTLFTSHPEVVAEFASADVGDSGRWRVFAYRTFDELHALLQERVPKGSFDAIIHAAAVSDFRSAGVHAPADGTRFDASTGSWQADSDQPRLHDISRGKVKSGHGEVWLRLVPTIKLVDQMRQPWGFGGVLVKFKLEVDVTETELHAIAEAARLQSQADLVVANTLDGMDHWALLGPIEGRYERVERRLLDVRLSEQVERLCKIRK
jgi:phosphopantothenoylcysteine synthetase/decarboxylase